MKMESIARCGRNKDMMTITVWKLDEYGYRRKSYEVFRIKGIRQSKDDCDIFYATLWNGVEWRNEGY